MSSFSDYQELNVLDLGCGVGRNSIFVAKSFQGEKCQIDCVDILPVAIELLEKNASEHGVQDRIKGTVAPIEDYQIAKDNYDLIMAISALEHIDSEEHFFEKLLEIKNGIRDDGIVCLVINSDVTEIDSATNEELMPNFEVNLQTDVILDFLDEEFLEWEVIKRSVSVQEYDIPRDGITSRLSTKVITFVARKIAL
ncbi:MAG: class I SAM-dependent methyltransferase [Butyrivibrio sp.]|nr:class I SAM-dependent methyltransferase [Butyrivibrio sp.]